MSDSADPVPQARAAEGVRAVDRALEILLAFGAGPPEMTALELARRTGLSRPTLYRLMHTLERHGFIASAGEPQRFRLGPTVGRLGSAWSAATDVVGTAQPFMHALREQTQETVALFVHQHDRRLCVAELPSTQPLSFKRGVGYSEPITTGASGRAILAHVDAAQFSAPSVRASQTELASIRERGYAVSRSELIVGAVAVAAPFFGIDGRIAGSMAVFGPQVRLDDTRIASIGPLVVEQCAGLSSALGRTG